MYGGHIYIMVTNNLYFRVMEHKEPKGRIVFSGLGGRKGENILDKIRSSGSFDSAAPNALGPINL